MAIVTTNSLDLVLNYLATRRNIWMIGSSLQLPRTRFSTSEDDPELFMYFHTTFHEARQPNSNVINDFKGLIIALDHIVARAPGFGSIDNLITGVPMYIILALLCNTPSGCTVFTGTKVNVKISDVWVEFPVPPKSCYILTLKEQ
ncbi:hypothetical protein EDD16DRAFT_499665 [Pisolithus croceorrhizus]|nr:hypothetical protein EDD16DRAFT_499665 [Pisolithus croceorrhizus]KAI6103683.1 hypothetical protein EV401DRAFT_2079522 [Pisolithus croceorrhizus]KAI6166527.1 hypothetical protein EDD17DRAFT_1543855 [Pisolithus thermaeus]